MTVVPATRASEMVTRSRARRAASALPAPRVSGMGTQSRAGRATDRDLRRARAATLKTTTKKKVATALVGARIRKRKRPAAAGTSEGAGKTLSEATEILKLKKEALAASRLWRVMGVPGALERWVKAREEEARAEPNKRKMVVKTRLPDAVIDVMKLHPYFSLHPMTDEELANQTESFRERYMIERIFNEKMNAYEQALIKQHSIKGYAEDETEVTSDE